MTLSTAPKSLNNQRLVAIPSPRREDLEAAAQAEAELKPLEPAVSQQFGSASKLFHVKTIRAEPNEAKPSRVQH